MKSQPDLPEMVMAFLTTGRFASGPQCRDQNQQQGSSYSHRDQEFDDRESDSANFSGKIRSLW